MATTSRRWQTGTPRETTEDEPLRCLCCGEPMGRATAWPTCGACLQEGNEAEPDLAHEEYAMKPEGVTTMTRMARWTRYEIINAAGYADLLSDEEPLDWPTDEDYEEAGFDPADEEITCGVLAAPFRHHPAGARVIMGLVVDGHHFAVEE